MKKSFTLFLLLASLMTASIAQAHSEGHGPAPAMAQTDIIPTATLHVQSLVDQQVPVGQTGKLDKKWLNVPASNKKIVRSSQGYHVVGFSEPKGKQTLFLLMAESGDLYDVNFSGKFGTIRD